MLVLHQAAGARVPPAGRPETTALALVTPVLHPGGGRHSFFCHRCLDVLVVPPTLPAALKVLFLLTNLFAIGGPSASRPILRDAGLVACQAQHTHPGEAQQYVCKTPMKAFGSTCASSGLGSGTRPAPRSPGGPTRQQGPRPDRAPLQELGWQAGSRELESGLAAMGICPRLEGRSRVAPGTCVGSPPGCWEALLGRGGWEKQTPLPGDTTSSPNSTGGGGVGEEVQSCRGLSPLTSLPAWFPPLLPLPRPAFPSPLLPRALLSAAPDLPKRASPWPRAARPVLSLSCPLDSGRAP